MKYINIFLLSFILLWLNDAASTHDKLAVRDALKSVFHEPAANPDIDWQDIQRYRSIDNTNITGRLLCINERQLQNLGVDLSNVKPAKLNAWRENNLNNTNHLRWAYGDDPLQVISSNRLERVPDTQ